MTAPHISGEEPLRAQASAFIDAIQSRVPPESDGDVAVAVVETLSQMLEIAS